MNVAYLVGPLALGCISLAYSSTTQAQTRTILDDDFHDNSSGWAVGIDPTREVSINGKLRLGSFKPGVGYAVWVQRRIREQNFSIEGTFRLVAAADGVEGYTGLVFGAADALNQFSFKITQDGKYNVVSVAKGQHQSVTGGWMPSKAINQGVHATNTLRVRGVGDKFLFDINGTNVDFMKAKEFFGNGVGFTAEYQRAIDATRLVVTESPGDPETPKVATSVAPATKLVVAVLAVEDAGGKIGRNVSMQLAEYLGMLLTQRGTYSVVASDMIRKELESAKLSSYSSCIDSACQIELGKSLAAQAIVSTKILRIGGACAVTSTLIDLKTESSLRATNADSKCAEKDLLTAMKHIAEKL